MSISKIAAPLDGFLGGKWRGGRGDAQGVEQAKDAAMWAQGEGNKAGVREMDVQISFVGLDIGLVDIF
uniref:OSJNBa0028M15.20 protein n=1 Tax=Oryza sativa subsp. japonica TaxID=39947 RepID=Q7XK67_ORYSJ|nr:OSJNBa0028M15.20 [Oryza sativa Japonica Group]